MRKVVAMRGALLVAVWLAAAAAPAWGSESHYDVLGVARDASAADIKRAYRKLLAPPSPPFSPSHTSS